MKKLLKTNKSFFLWIGLIVAGLAFGSGAKYLQVNVFSEEHDHASSSALFRPHPENIDELVASSDLVVVGRFGAVVEEGRFYGYGPDSQEIENIDQETTNPLSVPYIDISVRVSEVVYGEAPEEIIFRSISDMESFRRNSRTLFSRGDKLLFLSLNPDGETYGISSTMHLINIDGESPVFYHEGEARQPFEINDVEDFVDSAKLTATNLESQNE